MSVAAAGRGTVRGGRAVSVATAGRSARGGPAREASGSSDP